MARNYTKTIGSSSHEPHLTQTTSTDTKRSLFKEKNWTSWGLLRSIIPEMAQDDDTDLYKINGKLNILGLS